MSDALTNQRDAASEYETLLQFVYMTPVGIVKFRPDGRVEMANPMAAQLLMPLAPEFDMSNLYHALASIVPGLRGQIEAFGAPTGAICDQMQVTVPGAQTVLTFSIHKIDPDTLMAVIQDITRAIEQETRIRDDQHRFRAIFENVRDYAIYTVGLDGQIEDWNRSLRRIGGWEPADVTGAPIGVCFPKEFGAQDQSATLLDRARRSGTAEVEGWQVRKDASMFWGNTVASSLPNQDGEASGYVLVTRDLTERKAMEDRLVALSITDPMTHALNRRAGETKLNEAFRAWQRYRRPFSVLMIDCDHFKSVNDTWGHEGGDKVLIALVGMCQDELRSTDSTFRWGGEEFMVLLPETTCEATCAAAERLRRALEAAEIAYAGDVIRITVSIGAAEVCDADTCSDDLVRRVDRALYRAKNGGRNQVMMD